jgi:hypothetical protein
MRLLFGIILGVFLTIGGAYLYDSHNALDATNATNATTSAQRPMVNWDIVNTKWQHLTDRARSEWNRVAGLS